MGLVPQAPTPQLAPYGPSPPLISPPPQSPLPPHAIATDIPGPNGLPVNPWREPPRSTSARRTAIDDVAPELADLLKSYVAQNSETIMTPSAGRSLEYDDPDTDRTEGRRESDAEDEAEDAEKGDEQEDERRPRRRSRRRSRFNQQTVRQGQRFFQASCTECHDAERSTSKRKSYAGWLATVRRMAAKEDADIPTSQHTAIATYLASLNPAYRQADRATAEATDQEDDEGDDFDDMEDSEDAVAAELAAELDASTAASSSFTLNGTISPVYRGLDDRLENKGFFVDAWIGLEWRPPNNPLSAKVMACTSCHGQTDDVFNGRLGVHSVELVEAAVEIDICHLFCRCPPEKRQHIKTDARLKGGRILVPFGAFSSRVHPGALRTVSSPLMFNMGRRVVPFDTLQPVLNLPYADEGINLHLKRELIKDWSATLDAYAINGLQDGDATIFFSSRSYVDNNSNVAIGGRATIGNKRVRFGGSFTAGELQDEIGGFVLPRRTYKISGADVTFRHEDFFRASYEYAIRTENSGDTPYTESFVYGHVVEAEVLLTESKCDTSVIDKLSLLARYDTLEHGGVLSDTMETERFTYGLNFLMRGGSLLILNHEHWWFDNQASLNVMAARWTAAF